MLTEKASLNRIGEENHYGFPPLFSGGLLENWFAGHAFRVLILVMEDTIKLVPTDGDNFAAETVSVTINPAFLSTATGNSKTGDKQKNNNNKLFQCFS